MFGSLPDLDPAVALFNEVSTTSNPGPDLMTKDEVSDLLDKDESYLGSGARPHQTVQVVVQNPPKKRPSTLSLEHPQKPGSKKKRISGPRPGFNVHEDRLNMETTVKASAVQTSSLLMNTAKADYVPYMEADSAASKEAWYGQCQGKHV